MMEQVAAPGISREQQEESRELAIEGMTCANCARRIERALSAAPGVHEAHVNFATQRARVRFSPDESDEEALTRAVEAAGYRVVSDRAEGIRESAAPSWQSRDERLRKREEREQQTLRRDLAIAAALTAPLLALGMSHGALPFAGSRVGLLLQLALATIVVFGPGSRFLRLAWTALRHKSSDMNTLVSLGALAALFGSATSLWSARALDGHEAMPHVYFEAAGAIVTFVLLGKVLEARARRRLSDAVRGLVSLLPNTARRVRDDGQLEEIAIALLRPNDRVLVRPGERAPADGVVVEGSSAVDEALLTGESLPVDKSIDARVLGGSLNQTGALTLRIERTGQDTTLSRIVQAVEEAQGSRAPIARVADVVSGYFVPVVLLVALTTFLVWWMFDPTSHGLENALTHFVAVLVIACPCALGLATPAAVAVGAGRGAELGVLVKGGAALEVASRVNTVLFDKTGTLTAGKPQLTDVITNERVSRTALLTLVASLEQASEHPLAQAIVAAAREEQLALDTPQQVRVMAGLGIEGSVQQKRVLLGTRSWLEGHGISARPLEAQAEELAQQGRSPFFVAVDGVLSGLLAVADKPTAEAKRTVQALVERGIEVAMISGDRRSTAQAIARELGIERVLAELTPTQKREVVEGEKARGRVVAMVGDGINDAPALASASLGIAVGGATEIAAASADLALVRGGVSTLLSALSLSRATLRTIRQNLFWAFVYNVLALPLAAGALIPWLGFALSPIVASAAMSLSSVSVLLNSLRLRRFSADPI